MRRGWRIAGWSLLGLVLFGIGVFARQTFIYYRAIRSGQANPFLDRRLESSWSRLQANAQVKSEDLARLASADAPSMGPADASVTVVEFLDYDCPFSRQASAPVREALKKFQGNVRLVIRDFPIEELHPHAVRDALAARCANEQGRHSAYQDVLFANQDRHEETDLRRYALEVGMDVEAFSQCLQNKTPERLVQEDLTDGLQAGVQGTPTFFFNGIRVQGALDAATLEFLIRKSLQAPSKNL